MRLEDVTARIRPRGAWESVDLGFALVRRQFGQLLLAWCLTVGPLWAVLLIASNWVPIGWIVLIIWWLKPFYGRVPLFILSRSLFGAKPTLRETLRAWPRLLFSRFFQLIFTRVPWLVVLPNFAWNRALLLPVLDLEGQRGRGYKTRRSILLRQAGGASSGLTILCGGYQLCVVFALLALGSFVTWNPAEGSGALETLRDAIRWDVELTSAFVWTMVGSYLVSLTLVELFYIGGGFGLYLNSRTSLEGWDVELSFRQLAQRVAKAVAVSAAVCLLFCPGAQAQELERPEKKPPVTKERTIKDLLKQEEPKSPAAEDPLEREEVAHQDPAKALPLTEDQRKIQEILKHPDFKVHTVEREKPSMPDLSGMPNLGAWAQFLYYAGWVAFWCVLAGLAAWLGWLIWKNRHFFYRDRTVHDEPAVARTVMGLEITPESLPADILAAARAAWRAGDPRGALSLLYRGSLLWLVQSARLPIRESDTEGDCLRHSQTLPEPAQRDYFDDLTNQWVHAAYATHLPGAEVMERLLSTWPYQAPGQGRSRA